MDNPLAIQLGRGCEALGLDIAAPSQSALLEYLDLLVKWNRAYNLTAVRDPAQMVIRHLLDSLAITPYIPPGRLIDVGTGAGLPGVVLAIVLPQHSFDLLDSNGKKTRFLFQVKTDLRLDNMRVHHQRVESFQPPQAYDGVLSRAFASLQDMVGACKHLLGPQGRFLAMKGAYPGEELEVVKPLCELAAVHALKIPGLDEQRHLVEMKL